MTEPTDTAAERIRVFLDSRDLCDKHRSVDIIEAEATGAPGEYVDLSVADLRAVLAEREQLATRVAELDAELRKLRGTELNPSRMVLDAEAYGELRDEIAAAMTDDWDGDEAESWILIQYVRWLVAGQPRDEDGYPIRRETYPAAELEAERGNDLRVVRAVFEVPAGWQAGRALHELYGHFADRIAALDQRDTAKGTDHVDPDDTLTQSFKSAIPPPVLTADACHSCGRDFTLPYVTQYDAAGFCVDCVTSGVAATDPAALYIRSDDGDDHV